MCSSAYEHQYEAPKTLERTFSDHRSITIGYEIVTPKISISNLFTANTQKNLT